jgi:hypothetical protein
LQVTAEGFSGRFHVLTEELETSNEKPRFSVIRVARAELLNEDFGFFQLTGGQERMALFAEQPRITAEQHGFSFEGII